MPRGGKRKGAGRKKSGPTTRLTIPSAVLPEVQHVVNQYKQSKPSDSSLVLSTFVPELLSVLPQYSNQTDKLTAIALIFEDWLSIKDLPSRHKKIILNMLKRS